MPSITMPAVTVSTGVRSRLPRRWCTQISTRSVMSGSCSTVCASELASARSGICCQAARASRVLRSTGTCTAPSVCAQRAIGSGWVRSMPDSSAAQAHT
ncbi:MAG: hypothetical protein LCH79_01570 [Proteobacteria bacterium]|nr:hypothetical protein [Pseudomonadota bacterium]